MKTLTLNTGRAINGSWFLIQELFENMVRILPVYLQRSTTVLMVSITLFLMSKKSQIGDFIQSNEVLPLDSGNEALDRFYGDGIKLFVKRNNLPKTLEG